MKLMDRFNTPDKSVDAVATSLVNTFSSQLVDQTSASQRFIYRDFTLYRDTYVMPFYAPHLQVYCQHSDQEKEQVELAYSAIDSNHRGRIDALSLRLLYSDLELHQNRKPVTQIAALVFEMLEQLRVESLLPQQWPGMKMNIDGLFTHWSRTFYHSGLTDTAVGILLYTLAQVTRARLMAVAVLPETESLIEHTRAALAPVIGVQLSGLRRHRLAQNRFGDYALELAVIIEGMIAVEECVLPSEEQAANRDEVTNGFTILLDVASADVGGGAKADSQLSAGLVEAKQIYKVFTTQFDKVIFPANLVRAELLQEYRHHLDKLVSQQRINLSRLARQFSIKLSRPEVNGWQSSKDEGYIDGGRLSLLISSPSEMDLFYQPHLTPVIDCHVSLLVDCSGSMKTHVNQIATMLDILVRALDMAGVATEVLGFTTVAWNGGLALKQWRRQARPPNPGRLNPVSHLIFKHCDQSWRRARLGLASMLKLDLFREGIDGEAVQWASQRLLAQEASRKILVVISDGSPMDTATNQANTPCYLDNHLKDVVSAQQRLGVEVIGLGVGIDLSAYYPNNLAIDLEQELDVALFNRLIEAITKTKR